MLSRCSVPHTRPSVLQSSAPPSKTDIPLRDRQPLFVQTQACPVAVLHMHVCVGACVCFCVSTSACLCQASPERPGNQRKNRTGHYLNSLQHNFWRVFLKHDYQQWWITYSGTMLKVLILTVKCYSYISESCSVKINLSWVL